MHGKGPCDGHFATLKGWMTSYCTAGGLVNSLSSTLAAFNEGAAASMALHRPPEGPEYVQETVSTVDLGAKPSHVRELADTGPDHNDLKISETYCLKCVFSKAGAKKPKHDQRPFLIYDYGINNHIFSHRAACKPVGASSGWLRYEDTRIPAERRPWKTGNRDKKPEQEPFSLEKLQKRLKAQLHAGSMPKQTRRRLALANRGQKLLQAKKKLKDKSRRVTAAMNDLRAQVG